jgi:hypothetical protein
MGLKIGSPLNDLLCSQHVQSGSRETVFGGAAPLTIYVKWRSALCERMLNFALTGSNLLAHVYLTPLKASMPGRLRYTRPTIAHAIGGMAELDLRYFIIFTSTAGPSYYQ